VEEKLRRKLSQGLKQARKRAGLSLSDAAARITDAGFEMNRDKLMTWERIDRKANRGIPPAWAFYILSAAYSCPIGELFGEKPPSPAGPSLPPVNKGE
jgi:hypothetical protein